uniref:Uncharacterized protein n=1 Tax=Strigamia maritima TaxID=126957 RepID=T1JEN8_STRMM
MNTNDRYVGNGIVPIQIEGAKNVILNVNPQINKLADDAKAPVRRPIQRIKFCCEDRDSDGNAQCDVYKKKLQRFYSKLALPKISYLRLAHLKISHTLAEIKQKYNNAVTANQTFLICLQKKFKQGTQLPTSHLETIFKTYLSYRIPKIFYSVPYQTIKVAKILDF